ncbi:hypothetical protein M231_03804 [Tremella mesenterica]|uniref:DNA 3'-5' helicase n=1 Tax=Tremella mesenterica TaxID=5217 RepID=A0A4Q1BMB6_TREME|nr:hypothetical protein M231_03804 [Tremella mesenterica]
MAVGLAWQGVVGLVANRPRASDGSTVVTVLQEVTETALEVRPGRAPDLTLQAVTHAIGEAFKSEVATHLEVGLSQPRSSSLPVIPDIEVPSVRFNDLTRLGYRSGFRSPTQALVTEHMIKAVSDGIYIMPTGAGKTLPYFLTSSLVGTPLFVAVVVPFASLLEDLRSRAGGLGVKVHCWQDGQRVPEDCSLCLLAVEHVTSFLGWARTLSGRLHCVVVEEAHEIILSSSYRKAMTSVARLRALGRPTYLCSASIPPSLERPLLDSLGISNAWVARMSSSRPELGYQVWPQTVDSKHGLRVVCAVVEAWFGGALFGQVGKVIVYCQTKLDVDSVADKLASASRVGVARHHGSMSDEEKKGSVDSFAGTGVCLVMVSTIGLGAGVVWCDVMGVIFYDREDVLAWAEDQQKCRRWWLTKSVQGQGFTCVMGGERVMWCDNCSKMVTGGMMPFYYHDTREVWTESRWKERDGRKVPLMLVKDLGQEGEQDEPKGVSLDTRESEVSLVQEGLGNSSPPFPLPRINAPLLVDSMADLSVSRKQELGHSSSGEMGPPPKVSSRTLVSSSVFRPVRKLELVAASDEEKDEIQLPPPTPKASWAQNTKTGQQARAEAIRKAMEQTWSGSDSSIEYVGSKRPGSPLNSPRKSRATTKGSLDGLRERDVSHDLIRSPFRPASALMSAGVAHSSLPPVGGRTSTVSPFGGSVR